MPIIILEDLKGFRQTVQVARFPDVYEVAERPRPTVSHIEGGKVPEEPVMKRIYFYPHGAPEEIFGTIVRLYKQQD